jgi:hypothetical protein
MPKLIAPELNVSFKFRVILRFFKPRDLGRHVQQRQVGFGSELISSQDVHLASIAQHRSVLNYTDPNRRSMEQS